MQPIERYALVTLLFLVVFVTVTALWDDGSSESPEPKTKEVARLEEPGARRNADARSVAPRQAQRPLPMSGHEETKPEMKRVRTYAKSEGGHSVERGNSSDTLDFKPRRPEAQTPAELADLMTPERSGGETSFVDRPGGARPQSTTALNSSVQARQDMRPAAKSSAPSDATFKPRATGGTSSPSSTTTTKRKTVGGTKSRTYTIRSGDSLERIARRELPGSSTGSAVEEIAHLNGLAKPYTIYAGDELRIPASSAVASSSKKPSSPKVSGAGSVTPSGGRTVYTIQSGEVLSNVLVARYGTYKRSINLVKDLNPTLDPDRVFAGTKIVMPRADEIPGGAQKVANNTSKRPSRRATSASNEFVVR